MINPTRRLVLPALLLLAAACSTTARYRGGLAAPLPAGDFAASHFAAPTTTTATPPIADGIGRPYTIVKAGSFMPAGDIEDLDDGVSAELIFGRSLLAFLAIEGSIGYLATDGRIGPAQVDIWAIPLFVNARASIPIAVFEPYAGVGIGGLYADYEVGAFAESDFVAAWNAFIGFEVGLGRLAVGAEYKYIGSEDNKDDFAIEGETLSLFASIPF